MPTDKNGRFWKPSCGVIQCQGRRCFNYSLNYECCLSIVFFNLEVKALESKHPKNTGPLTFFCDFLGWTVKKEECLNCQKNRLVPKCSKLP